VTKKTNWWKTAHYREVSQHCDNCNNSKLQCGYLWCNLHNDEVYDGRVCDDYEGYTDEGLPFAEVTPNEITIAAPANYMERE